MEVMPHAEDIHKNYLQKLCCSVKKHNLDLLLKI